MRSRHLISNTNDNTKWGMVFASAKMWCHQNTIWRTREVLWNTPLENKDNTSTKLLQNTTLRNLRTYIICATCTLPAVLWNTWFHTFGECIWCMTHYGSYKIISTQNAMYLHVRRNYPHLNIDRQTKVFTEAIHPETNYSAFGNYRPSKYAE